MMPREPVEPWEMPSVHGKLKRTTLLTVNGEEVDIGAESITASRLKKRQQAPAHYSVIVKYTWGEKYVCEDEHVIVADHVEAVSISDIPGLRGKENTGMGDKPYILNINGKEYEIGQEKISAGALKRKFGWDARCWVAVTRRWGGEPEFLDDNEEIIVNKVETVSVTSPSKLGLNLRKSSWLTKWRNRDVHNNPELKRLHGRLAMEAAFLTRMEKYGKVSFKIAENGSEAFVFVSELQIGDQWNIPVVDIFIKIPAHSPGYPTLKLDNFFVSKNLRTVDGQKPVNLWTEGDFDWLDKRFLQDGYAQFSFHMEQWNPVYDTEQQEFTQGDSLLSYLAAISDMFHRPAKVEW